jgi:hypothetical protein
MTLVIVKKNKNKIEVSSDSRVTYGTTKFDIGVKTTKIRVSLYPPMLHSDNSNLYTRNKHPDYDFDIGICHTGSITAFNTIKENLALVLGKLEYTPDHFSFTFEGLVHFIRKYYDIITTETKMKWRDIGLSEIVLVGQCPMDSFPRAFILYDEMIDGVFQGAVKELLLENEIEFFGSGKKVGRDVYIKFPEKPIINIINYVIENNLHNEVGGYAQYGSVEQKGPEPASFVISGVVYNGLYLNGIDVHEDGDDDECYSPLNSYLMMYDPYEFGADHK